MFSRRALVWGVELALRMLPGMLRDTGGRVRLLVLVLVLADPAMKLELSTVLPGLSLSQPAWVGWGMPLCR